MIARYETRKNPGQLEIIEVKSDTPMKMGIGFRKEDTKLRDSVQKAFNEVIADGTAKKISEKWFQSDLIIHKL